VPRPLSHKCRKGEQPPQASRCHGTCKLYFSTCLLELQQNHGNGYSQQELTCSQGQQYHVLLSQDLGPLSSLASGAFESQCCLLSTWIPCSRRGQAHVLPSEHCTESNRNITKWWKCKDSESWIVTSCCITQHTTVQSLTCSSMLIRITSLSSQFS
jgi:hypothetical protein